MPGIANPYAALDQARFRLRGNLHTHTNLSDGADEPQQVIDAYAEHGYDFLELSDHDRLADAGTLAAYDNRGMLLIPGNEISANGPHILHVNASALVVSDPDRQKVFDEVRRSGGLAIVNHPNWQQRFDHCPIAEMERWQGYAGLEIYNGIIRRVEGSPDATGKWDMLLSRGRRVWGYATDDSHKSGDRALAWNVVFCARRCVDAVVEALASGAFYASTGVAITDIRVRNGSVRIETENARKVVAVINYGRRIAESAGTALTVEIPAGASYLRFECYGCAEEQAWTQPFFVEG